MIRPAIPADARPIAEVHVRTWQEAYRGIVPDAVLDALDVDDRERRWKHEWLATPPPGVETAMTTEGLAISTRPTRCSIAIFTTGQRCRAA